MDARILIDVDKSVAKHAGREDGQRDKWASAGGGHGNELGARKFGQVKFEAPHHPVENLSGSLDKEIVQVDALNGNFTRAKSFRAIVAATSKCQGKAAHKNLCRMRVGSKIKLQNLFYLALEAAQP